MLYKKSEAKEWAKGFYRGLGSTILPSFTPDTLELDEKGIRHDIRELIRHGFFSTAIVTEVGTTKDEDRRMIEWCVDEARGKIGITVGLRYYTLKDNIEMARYSEQVGADAVLLSYPPNFYPKAEKEVYDYTLALCESTNIAVELFPSLKCDFPFPGIFPARLLKRMADIENVVAMKIGILDFAWIDECYRLFGDTILISYPFDDAWPVFIRKYGMQWSGAAPWQVFQTPDDPREVRMFGLIQEGRMDEAMELYWKGEPLRKYFIWSVMTIMPLTGTYNFQQWKYMEGLAGMTGGELRLPKIEFFARDRQMAKMAMVAAGLKVADRE
jgi:dihydrodipicolinate synthase/N-acetylneuraminate lyase